MNISGTKFNHLTQSMLLPKLFVIKYNWNTHSNYIANQTNKTEKSLLSMKTFHLLVAIGLDIPKQRMWHTSTPFVKHTMETKHYITSECLHKKLTSSKYSIIEYQQCLSYAIIVTIKSTRCCLVATRGLFGPRIPAIWWIQTAMHVKKGFKLKLNILSTLASSQVCLHPCSKKHIHHFANAWQTCLIQNIHQLDD